VQLNLYPSIHFLYPLTPIQGHRVGWSLSQLSLGERQGIPWTGRQSITGPHRDKRDKQQSTLTPLESPINLRCMFLDGGRLLEYPERTRAYTGRTCKLHTERPRPTLSIWLWFMTYHFSKWPVLRVVRVRIQTNSQPAKPQKLEIFVALVYQTTKASPLDKCSLGDYLTSKQQHIRHRHYHS